MLTRFWREAAVGMITVEVPEAQVIEWIRQLSPAGKRAVLDALIPHLDRLEVLVGDGSERMRTICAERGLDWDALGEGERARLVDDMLHEN
jgi:hypothetical protein